MSTNAFWEDMRAEIQADPEYARLHLKAAHDLYDEGWAGTVTTDRIIATIGGILGGITLCAALLYRYSRHLNATSKGHRP